MGKGEAPARMAKGGRRVKILGGVPVRERGGSGGLSLARRRGVSVETPAGAGRGRQAALARACLVNGDAPNPPAAGRGWSAGAQFPAKQPGRGERRVLRSTGLKAIAAMSRNRVIGRGGGLPWHLPGEFRWFREATLGHAVLMGRRTFEGLPGGPLPGRWNLVATRQGFSRPPGEGGEVEIVPDLAAFQPERHEAAGRTVFVAGGESVYRQMLPRCTELWLTVIDQDVGDGDTFFPPFEEQFDPAGTLRRGAGFEVRRFLRRPPPRVRDR